MKIDLRKKEQYFKNINGLNDVYVWKNTDKTFNVGINGTSFHYKVSNNTELIRIVSELIHKK